MKPYQLGNGKRKDKKEDKRKDKRLKLIYNYILHSAKHGRVNLSDFHRKFSLYQRKQTTFEILKKYKNRIYTGPLLTVPYDCYGELLLFHNFPAFKSYEERKMNPMVNHSILCCGTFSLISFIRGIPPPPSNDQINGKLTYYESLIPSFPSNFNISDMNISNSASKLPRLRNPTDWDELDWNVYKYMKNPNESSYSVSKELHVDYKTVLGRLKKIMRDCRIWISFFPRGIGSCHECLVALKTDYEINIKKELMKLDRTSYIYKVGDIVLLHLFLDRESDVLKFHEMEKEELISLFGISTPLVFYNAFTDF